MGKYPITREAFEFVESLMAFTAFDENGIVGFFTLRNPGEKRDELRIGFVIIDPERRGCGTGKEGVRWEQKGHFIAPTPDRCDLAIRVQGVRRVAPGT